MMNFITKIEEFINDLLLKLGDLIVKLVLKIIPKRLLKIFTNFKESIDSFKSFVKNLPQNCKLFLIQFLTKTKTKLTSIDYKAHIISSLEFIKMQYKTHLAKGGNKFKAIFLAPIKLIGTWVQGLTPFQSVALLGLTTASILSFLSIISTSNRLFEIAQSQQRAPASIEDEAAFDRPDYYKKEKRHVLMSSVRLPVYNGDINDLQTVDIDFNVTLSNRQTRNSLEKLEFQLRDYLILKLEPQIPDFALQEEGKEIIRKKIWFEIDSFLKEREINGHVLEVKITYVLAN
jgi:flagellar basal body-associated protein FliL